MSIQSKSARILAVISVLALASACGEGVEGAEQQESPAQMAPDSLKEQEADLYTRLRPCPECQADFWGIGPDGRAGGWICEPSLPNTFFDFNLFKRVNGSLVYLGQGKADAYNEGLKPVCGGSPHHQFSIYVGPWNGGPGVYVIQGYSLNPPRVFSRDYIKY